MTWMWTAIGLATAAHAGNRLAWQTPGTSTYTPSTDVPERAEQVCADDAEVVAGWGTSGFADLSTQLWWDPGAKTLSADWWSVLGAHAGSSFSSLGYGAGEHQVSPLCANPGHCMEIVRAWEPSVTRIRTVQAICPATMYAIAGGYRVTGATNVWKTGNVVRITESAPNGVFAPTGWKVTAHANAVGAWGLEVQVTCAPWEALAYVRSAPLTTRLMESYQLASLGKPAGNSAFYPLSDLNNLLPLSTGANTWVDDGLVGAQARNLLWTFEDGPLPFALDTVNQYPSLSPSGWQVRPFGIVQAAAVDFYNTSPQRTYPFGSVMYVAPADRAAFEAAVYCDGDPPRHTPPDWMNVRIPTTFTRPFRALVYLPFDLPVDDGFGPPPFGAVSDGLPVGVMTYTSYEDQRAYLDDMGRALDEAGLRWVEVSAVESTFDYGDDTVVLVATDAGAEREVADWIVAKREELVGLGHPTVVLLTEDGEGTQALGLGGDLW